MLFFRKNMIKKTQKLVFGVALLALFFAFGYYTGVEQENINKPAEEIDLTLFWEAYNQLENNFVNPDKIKNEEIVYGAIQGMVNSLDDPHTKFFSPEESKKFLEDVSGYYEGVGMEVGLRNDRIEVISPIKNTPAEAAGVKSGDVITEIEDRSTEDMTLEEAVKIMRGEQGTEVTIKIARNGEIKTINLQRDKIQIPSLEFEVLDEDIAYLKVHYFHQDLHHEFNKLLPQITSSNTDKMIIDLRNNPGGALNSALEIAEFFLDSGDTVVKSQKLNGEIIKDYKATGSSVTFDHDLVVLLNEGSASASEIMAGALRHHKNAKIVGETSYGKGSIQTLINLSDMSNLKVTVSHWVMPNDELIEDVGIKPDYQVSFEEESDDDEDPQLEKAIEIIK